MAVGARWLIPFIMLSLVIPRSWANNGWEGHSFQLFWENDVIAGKDRHYTQGAGFNYLSEDNILPDWLIKFTDVVPAWEVDVKARKVGFGVVQEMYTPENLRTSRVVEDDQPYAGWLYGRFSVQRRGRGMFDLEAIESIHLDLGVVGPESLAEETQKTWHGEDPAGWSHQLKTEVGVNLGYQRQYLIPFRKEESRWGFDLIPHINLEAGNVSTFVEIGGEARFGYQIPNEFETGSTDTDYRYGFYLRVGGMGRAVARNIFLDGNAFKDSHSVEKYPWIAGYHVGITFVLKQLEFNLLQTFHTREFREQSTSDSVGHASATWKF